MLNETLVNENCSEILGKRKKEQVVQFIQCLARLIKACALHRAQYQVTQSKDSHTSYLSFKNPIWIFKRPIDFNGWTG